MNLDKYFEQKTNELLTDENLDCLRLYEMVAIVKKLTSDFDILALSLFRRDVAWTLVEVYYFETDVKKINDIKVNTKDKKLNIQDFTFKFSAKHSPSGETFTDKDSGIEFKIYDLTSQIEFINFAFENYGIFDNFGRLLDFAKVVDAKYRELKPVNYDFREYSFVDYYLKERDKATPKQHLTFAGLFKPEYTDRLTVLFERLKLNGYTDENNDWIIKTDTNEPAKLFHYLKDNNVFITSKFAPSIKCFYKEFGCEVVEKINGNPRATTRKNADDAKNSVDESAFNNFVLSWIDKK